MKVENAGSRIKEIRKHLGLSQVAFAQSLGVTNAHISSVEAGRSCLSRALCRLICEKFGVNESWLEDGKGEMKLFMDYKTAVSGISYIAGNEADRLLEETVGSRIKKVRKIFHLSQKEFAEQLGVTQTTISGIESRKKNTSNTFIKCLCRQFNISETWLREGAGEMFVGGNREARDGLDGKLISRDGTEKFVRCAGCVYCIRPEGSCMFLCSNVKGLTGLLDPSGGDGCSRGRYKDHGMRDTEGQGHGS